MTEVLDTLRDVVARLSVVGPAALAPQGLGAMDDASVLQVMDAAAALLRHAEALLVDGAAVAQERSQTAVVADRMTTAFGARNVRDLVERTTRLSGARAAEIVRAAGAVGPRYGALSGDVLPSAYPALRSAMAEGVLGADAVAAVARELDRAAVGPDQLSAADVELAASARGDGPTGGGLPTADELRLQAQVWAVWLDPDGAEPRDDLAQRKRGLSLGRARDGLVPIRGMLLPDVAGALQRATDSILNPRVEGPASRPDGDGSPRGHSLDGVDAFGDDVSVVDQRTRAQKMHDALATIVTTATRSGALPTRGGAAPTLLVSVRAGDLASNRGVAHIDGSDAVVPLAVARQVACTGGIHRVFVGDNGRVERIEVVDRVFTPAQRRAITVRDGGCVIPGCDVPAAWCEIHHVTPHARGGATHTDNGVLLCWHHHRTIDVNGWAIRMRNGVPQVRGPSWWDPLGHWRPATASPTRTQDALDHRRRARGSSP
ncbi:MAG: DUF222 domain-containing protein [Actinobacteria bacterium]|nr:DUF222 domain-containing protein [Actinomycetota bacterium]